MYNPNDTQTQPTMPDNSAPVPQDDPTEESSEDDVQVKLEALSQMVADLQATLGAKMQPPAPAATEMATEPKGV